MELIFPTRHLFSRLSLSFVKCTAKRKGQNTCRGCGRQLWKLPRHAIMMDKSCYFSMHSNALAHVRFLQASVRQRRPVAPASLLEVSDEL